MTELSLHLLDAGDTGWITTLVDEAQSPLAQAVGRESLERYERALQQLTRQQQELIVMRMELGLDNAEMAAELGSSPDAARMALRRAVTSLVAVLSDAPR